MKRTTVKDALASTGPVDPILVQGWVRTRRDAKGFSFLEINDGSSLKGVQVVVDAALPDYAHVAQATTGAAVSITGRLVASQGAGQKWEVQAQTLAVLGGADASYPLQKKGHTLEFLREIAHLRPRSNLFGAVFRTRSRLAHAIHAFFQERGFVYVHTPIITASDCEGAGELFRVTTLDAKQPPLTPEGAVDFAQDFFAKKSLPHRERSARGGDLRLRLEQRLHLRPDLPRREFEHLAPCERILDGRARDGLLRPGGRHGPRRGVREGTDPRRAGTLRRRPGVLRQVRGQGPARPPRFRAGAAVRAYPLHRGGRDPRPERARRSSFPSPRARTSRASTSAS